jgi:hypothetical protein
MCSPTSFITCNLTSITLNPITYDAVGY